MIVKHGNGWDRMLWGIEFSGSAHDEEPMLIGTLWASDIDRNPYPGEPTRALLFCSRKEARAWCAKEMAEWREGRRPDDIVMRWRVRPVRVRETVQVCKKPPLWRAISR